jgi:hypothetical protein
VKTRSREAFILVFHPLRRSIAEFAVITSPKRRKGTCLYGRVNEEAVMASCKETQNDMQKEKQIHYLFLHRVPRLPTALQFTSLVRPANLQPRTDISTPSTQIFYCLLINELTYYVSRAFSTPNPNFPRLCFRVAVSPFAGFLKKVSSANGDNGSVNPFGLTAASGGSGKPAFQRPMPSPSSASLQPLT